MLATTMIAVLVAVTAALGYLGAAVVARHQAQAAADLAALAAAYAVTTGPAQACARAEALASTMRAHVTQCRVDGLDVVLDVQVPVRLGRWGVGPAVAAARAGPVYPAP